MEQELGLMTSRTLGATGAHLLMALAESNVIRETNRWLRQSGLV
jgi:hypothetical protein